MITGDLALSTGVICKLLTLPNHNGSWRTEIGECFDGELMQFTGLQDKNGKDIYCSDFLGVSKDKYGEIYWNENELAWWVEPIRNYPNEPLRGKGGNIKVLGNKYQGLA